MDRTTVLGLRVASLIPLAWCMLFSAFVVRAWISLGYRPTPYRPDPKDLGFDWHMMAIYYGFLVSLATVVLFPALMSYLKRHRYKLSPAYPAAFMAGWAGIASILLLDVGRFASWFMD
jgi:hypothetical protein